MEQMLQVQLALLHLLQGVNILLQLGLWVCNQFLIRWRNIKGDNAAKALKVGNIC